jgi:hypothetical protein
MTPQPVSPELMLAATRNPAFGEAALDLQKAQANDASANAADAQGQARLRQLQIQQAGQTQAAIRAAYQNAITNPATQGPSAATSTPAAMQASTLPGGLVNRTGQSVDGVPSLGAAAPDYTLGGIGSQAAAAQQTQTQAAPAPVFDTSPAAITGRMRAQLQQVLPPAQMKQWEDSVKGSLDNEDMAVKLHAASVASRDNDIQNADYKAAGGDPDKTVALMKQHGVTPAGIAKFSDAMTGVAQHAATLTATQIDNGIKQGEGLAAALTAYAKQPRQVQLENWQQFGEQMVNSGKWDPKTDGEIPATAPTADEMNAFALHHLTFAHMLDAERGKREALTASNAEADRKVTQAREQQRLEQEAVPKTPAELALVASDPAKTPQQRDAANAALKRLDAYQQAGRSVTNINGPQPALGGTTGAPLTGTPFLGTLKPADAARVKAIAEGREAPLTGVGASRGQGAAIMAAVEQYDPGWSAQRAQLRKTFTSGPDGRNIGNLNTAPVHLEQLAQAAQAMQNGTFVPGNQIYNAVARTFGGSAPTNFDAMKTVVAGEMASAMKGNATDPEIAAFNKSVKDASSPAQLAGAIQKTFLPALAAKLQTYNERYHAQSTPDDPWTPVLPSARAVFSRYGIDPAAPAKAAQNQPIALKDGTFLTPHDAAAGAKFRKDHPELIK